MPGGGGNTQPASREAGGQSCPREPGLASPYLLCLPCWALVGRHGIWRWSPSSL